MVLPSFPFLERRKLLGYSGEETNDDTNGGGFHVVAELTDNFFVLLGVSVAQKR